MQDFGARYGRPGTAGAEQRNGLLLPSSHPGFVFLIVAWARFGSPPYKYCLIWQAPSASENVQELPPVGIVEFFLLYKRHGGYAPCMPAPGVWLDSFQGASTWGHTISLIVLPSHMTFYNLISLVAILPSDFPSRITLSYLFWAQVCWFLRRGQGSRNRFPTWKCQRQRPQKNYTNSSVQVRVQHVSERLSHFSWCLGVNSQRPE